MLLDYSKANGTSSKLIVEVGAVVTGTEKCTACVAGGAAMFLVVAGKMKAVAVGIVGTG
jgi:hypothetical protein